MPKRTGPTDPNIIELIHNLKKMTSETDIKLWKALAKRLEKPRRHRAAVNLSKINRYTKEDEIAVVPGAVLSAGTLEHRVTIAALKFSENAKEKITQMKGNAITIQQLIESNPDVKKIKIIV